MSKLRMRLEDATRSGVYRAAGTEAIEEAGVALARIALPAGKDAILRSIAKALGFPEWFGNNWDALEDCLSDLSWRGGEGHVLLFTEFTPGDELGVLIDVLGSSAESWRERGKPFFAVFIDPQRRLQLPGLYREA